MGQPGGDPNIGKLSDPGRSFPRRRGVLNNFELDQLREPLATPAEAKRRFELIQSWVLAKRVTPTQGKIWLRAEVAEQDRTRMAELEEVVERLRNELHARQANRHAPNPSASPTGTAGCPLPDATAPRGTE